jgi:hypothetical protein
MRVSVADGESADSWIEAVARRHQVAPRTLLAAMGIRRPVHAAGRLIDGTVPAAWRRVEQAAGLPPGRLDAAAGGQIAAVSRLRTGGSRYCPQCLAGSGGRWQLTWRMNWAVACPRHQALLRDSCLACGAAPRTTIPGGSEPVPAGTCTHIVRGTRRRCGADLAATPALPAGTAPLSAQAWIDGLLAGLRGPARLATGARIPPPGLPAQRWKALTGEFPSRYLRAADADLTATDRLRMRTVTPSAALPSGHGAQRARMLPQLLWPDWTARLLPVTGFEAGLFRAVMSACVLIPGSASRTLASLAAELNPRLGRAHVSVTLQGYGDSTGGTALRPVLILLCRLAGHLDAHGAPIDYQRRRQLIPAETISWECWRDLACSAGAHPGDLPSAGRHLHAQRHLHQLLSGADLTDPRHPLRFCSPGDRNRYHLFATSMTPAVRAAVRGHAAWILSDLGVGEPLTWSPPSSLAAGLDLPGVDIDDLDLAMIRRIVIAGQRPAGDAADALGINIEHVRLALERIKRPERQWSSKAAPNAWLREQEANRLLTRGFFEREYIRGGRRLTDIAASTGFPRRVLARHAKNAGIALARASTVFPADERWLREQYLRGRRSTTDIAAELGSTQMTVSRALHRLGIPIRPQGVRSHPHMIATMDQRLPRDIRATVEGSLHGWHRLNRFRIAMAFPSLETASSYLGAHPTALVTQFQRLETDIGGKLFRRSAFGKPHQPTQRGKQLLAALERTHIQALMNAALGDDQVPAPSPAILARATARGSQRRGPGPLRPFDGIAVERVRIRASTLTLLRDLLEQPGEFYGLQVAARTGIADGTIYPTLSACSRPAG